MDALFIVGTYVSLSGRCMERAGGAFWGWTDRSAVVLWRKPAAASTASRTFLLAELHPAASRVWASGPCQRLPRRLTARALTNSRRPDVRTTRARVVQVCGRLDSERGLSDGGLVEPSRVTGRLL
jgi:hypothetical protein